MTSGSSERPPSRVPATAAQTFPDTQRGPDPGARVRLVALPLAVLVLLIAPLFFHVIDLRALAPGVLVALVAFWGAVKEYRHRRDAAAQRASRAALLVATGVVLAPLCLLLSALAQPAFGGNTLMLAVSISVLVGIVGSVQTILSLRGPGGEYRRNPLGAISALFTSLVHWTPLLLLWLALSRQEADPAGYAALVLAVVGLVTGIVAVLQARPRKHSPTAPSAAASHQAAPQ